MVAADGTIECGNATMIADGPMREGQQIAERATKLLDGGNYNSAASVAVIATNSYRQAAECYASTAFCAEAVRAAEAADTSATIASDAADKLSTAGVIGAKASAEQAADEAWKLAHSKGCKHANNSSSPSVKVHAMALNAVMLASAWWHCCQAWHDGRHGLA